MHRLSILLVTALAIGCSSGADTEPIRAEETAPSPPDPEVSPSDPEADEPEPSSEDQPLSATVGVLQFADDARPRIESLPRSSAVVPGSVESEASEDADDYARLSYGLSRCPQVEFPEHADALNTQLCEEAGSLLSSLGMPPGEGHGAGNCSSAVATPELVVMVCQGMVFPDRGYPSHTIGGRSYHVRGSELHPFGPGDALLPGPELSTALARRCRRSFREFEDRAEYCDNLHASISFGPTALRAFIYDPTGESDEQTELEIPYAELSGRIVADTPLGRALREGATVEQVPRPEGFGESHRGWAVSDEATPAELMHRWAQLPQPDQALVRVGRVDGQRGRLVVVESTAPEDATRIATAAGAAAAEPFAWQGARLEPVWVRTRAELNLRHGPARYAGLRAALPRGALVLALRGRFGARDSAFGQRDTWAFVSPSPAVAGWAGGNLLVAHEGCRPSADAFIAGLPESGRERARGSLFTAISEVRRGGTHTPAVMFGATARGIQRAGSTGRMRVEVRALDADTCAIGERLGRHDIEGAFFSSTLTSTARHGGRPVIVIGARVRIPGRGASVRYSVFELGASEVGWSGVAAPRTPIRVGAPINGEGYAILQIDRRENREVIEHSDDGFAARQVPAGGD